MGERKQYVGCGHRARTVRAGRGRAVLFLHGAQGVLPAAEFLDLLAESRKVIAPSHPGFGKSELPTGSTAWRTSRTSISN